MQVAVVVLTVPVALLSLLLMVFLGIIFDIYNEGGSIIIIRNGGGIIYGSADMMITI